MAVAVGRRSPRLAQRVRGDEPRPARRGLRPPRAAGRTCASRITRTSGPRPSRSASGSPTTGCTTASSSTPRARRCRRASATSTTCSTCSSATTAARTGCCCCRATTAARCTSAATACRRPRHASAGLDAFAARTASASPTRPRPTATSSTRSGRRWTTTSTRPKAMALVFDTVRRANTRARRRRHRRGGAARRRGPRDRRRRRARARAHRRRARRRAATRPRELDAARAAKDYAPADAIRAELQADGWIVETTATAPPSDDDDVRAHADPSTVCRRVAGDRSRVDRLVAARTGCRRPVPPRRLRRIAARRRHARRVAAAASEPQTDRPRPAERAASRAPVAEPSRPADGLPAGLDGLRAVSVIGVILLPRRVLVDARRVLRRRGVLRRLRLPDHVAADRRARARTAVIDLGQFWLRRARRLLPALFAVLAGGRRVGDDRRHGDEQQAQLRRDFPWAIFYAGNWGQILGDVPYYAGDPPLLRHLWSLAVEEQWYLLWPLVFVGAERARRLRSVSDRRAARGAALVVMVLTWRAARAAGPDQPLGLFGGVDRVNFMYLSTFTRARGLLLGAAAAFVWRPWRRRSLAATRRPAARVVLDVAGALARRRRSVAIAAVGRAHRGLRVPVAAAARVGPVARRRARRRPPGAARLPDGVLVAAARRGRQAQLRAVPVALADLRARRGDPRVRRPVRRGALAVTAVVSELCYRFVETPVRKGALGRWFASAGEPGRSRAARRSRRASCSCSSGSTPRSTRSTGPPAGRRGVRRAGRDAGDRRPAAVAGRGRRPDDGRARRRAARRTRRRRRGDRRRLAGPRAGHQPARRHRATRSPSPTARVDGCSIYDAAACSASAARLQQLLRDVRRLGRQSGRRRSRTPTPRSRSSCSAPGTCSTSRPATARS